MISNPFLDRLPVRATAFALLLSISMGLSGSAFAAAPEKKASAKAPVKAGSPGKPATASAATGLSAIVGQANKAASQKNYPEAIRLYEQATAKAPNDKTLKNNLSILYANYGVALQENSRFEEAQAAFDRSLALTPQDSPEYKSIQETKGSSYYTQAMDLRSKAQSNRIESSETGAEPSSATPVEYSKVRALLEKAIAISPDQSTYKQGMASTYLDEAYELATKEKYAEAAPLLEQAMTYDSNSPAIRQSLANVYLGLARNDAAHRKAWVDKAKTIDNSEQVRQTAEKIMGQSTPAPAQQGQEQTAPSSGSKVKSKLKGFLVPAGTPGQVPRELSKLSVLEMIRLMESQLGLHPSKDASLMDRLEAIEKPVMGQVGNGAMTMRTKSAYITLMGNTDSLGTSTASNNAASSGASSMLRGKATGTKDAAAAASLKPGAAAGMSAPMSMTTVPVNTYLDHILEVTDGKIVRWGRFPLRVYIDSPIEPDKKADKKNSDKGEASVKTESRSAETLPPLTTTPKATKVDTKTTLNKPEKKYKLSEEAQEVEAVKSLYKTDFRQAVLDGMAVWGSATNGFARIIEVKNPAAADVHFQWVSQAYVDRFADPSVMTKTSDTFKNYVAPKRSPMMHAVQVASMVTPGFYSLAPQALNAAMQYKQLKRVEVIHNESVVKLGLAATKDLDTASATMMVQNMVAREFGHVLGLKASSDKTEDLMFAGVLSTTAPQTPTQRDINTLRAVYERPANIVLNIH